MSTKAPSKAARAAIVYSTSEARANFAEALETASKDGAVIGFDRYGRTVAALVPLEAIYLLAGRGQHIAPSTRERIERYARNLVQDISPESMQPKREKMPGSQAVARAVAKPKGRGPVKPKRRPDS